MKSINIKLKPAAISSDSLRKMLEVILVVAFIIFALGSAFAQQAPVFTNPNITFGVAAGGNINFYRGSTQKLNADITAPIPFQSGTGLGLFVAPMVEYHFLNSQWGMMLQAGYDSRRGTYEEVISLCNCPRDLSTEISYITVEPSARFAPIKNNGLYLFSGPRVAINVNKSFTYQQKNNPDFPDQEQVAVVKGDLSDVNSVLISVQIGAGYDIPLSAKTMQMKYILSPFISFQPYFGQSPRSIETWNVTTLRAGIALKIGKGIPAKTDLQDRK